MAMSDLEKLEYRIEQLRELKSALSHAQDGHANAERWLASSDHTDPEFESMTQDMDDAQATLDAAQQNFGQDEENEMDGILSLIRQLTDDQVSGQSG